MASSEGRRDVPDSEDEPMTWSPVHVSDGGASDKLCATARVPLQDTQGAPKEATRHLLAPAKSDANVPDRRLDGLDADRVDASVDVDSANNSTSSQLLPRDAHDSSCLEHSESALHSKLVPDLAPAPQTSVPSNIVSHDQPAADFEVTRTPDAELPTPTDNTMHNAEPTGHGHQVEATPEHVPPSSSRKCEPTPSLRIGEEQAASQGDLDEPVSSKHDEERTEAQQKSTSSIDDAAAYGGTSHAVAKDPGSQAHHDGCDGQNNAGNVLTQDVDGRTYVPDVSTSTNDQSNLETNFESSSTSGGIDSCSMTIAGESQSIMKDDASAPSCSISMVSSTSLPSTDIPQCTGEPSADTAVRAAPSTSEPEPVSTIQFPVPGSGVSLDSSSATSPQATAAADTPVTAKTPQEITLADLKVQKATMLASLAALPAIRVLMEETATSNTDMSDDEGEPTEADVMAAANKIVKDHIKLLHEYNELKDVGQGLMGLIADQRGVRIVEVQEEFGIEAND